MAGGGPVEAAAEGSFDDEVVSACSGDDTNAEVDLPPNIFLPEKYILLKKSPFEFNDFSARAVSLLL